MRVLLADDHALFRAGIASLLKAWGLEVVGQAGDGDEAILLARQHHPDLVFMDISTDGETSISRLSSARVTSPRLTRLICSRLNSAVNLRLPSLALACVSIDRPPPGHHTTPHVVSRPIGEQSNHWRRLHRAGVWSDVSSLR